MSLVDDTLALLRDAAAARTLPRVRALHLPPAPPPGGLRGEFCALELEDGSLGLSYVLLGDTWAQLTANAGRHVQPGDDPLALAQSYTSADTLQRTLGFAAVNAITRCVLAHAGWAPPHSSDSIGQLDPQPGETIGMIGHFTPLLPRLLALGAKVTVLELRTDLVGERNGVRVTLDPAELSGCDKVLATGTLLLNHTLEPMLAACRHARRFVLVGPSVGAPPDPLFARGVTLLGGSWVEDGTGFLRALGAGVPPGASVRKFALTPAGWPGWPAMLAGAGRPPSGTRPSRS